MTKKELEEFLKEKRKEEIKKVLEKVKHLSDEELISRYLEGNCECGVFVLRYISVIEEWVEKLKIPTQDISDLCHIIFTEIISNKEELTFNKMRFAEFMQEKIDKEVNKFKERLRKEYRKETPLDSITDEDKMIDKCSPTLKEKIEDKDTSEQLARIYEFVFSQLPKKYEEVLTMKYILKMTNLEIAEEIPCNKDTVTNRLRKAEIKILELVKDKPEGQIFKELFSRYLPILFILPLIVLLITFIQPKTRERIIYPQSQILLKHEIKQENKIIKWIKKFFKKEEAKENNWQERK